MARTEIEFGDFAPEGLNYATAWGIGRRVHYTDDWNSNVALCGTGVTRGPERLGGYLCPECEKLGGKPVPESDY